MNIKGKILFFLLICAPFFLYAQHDSGIVIYGQKIFVPNDLKSSKKSEFSSYYNEEREKMNESSSSIRYELKFNGKEASCKVRKYISISDSDNSIDDALIHVRGDGEHYFSSKTNLSLWAHNVFGRDVILVDTISSVDWKITKETKKIGKYKVIKAIKKKILPNKKIINIIAWFSPEIPNNYGPVGYYGLPGLILELQGRDFIIYAKKVKFKKRITHIDKPSKGDYLTKEEYDAYIERAVKNLFRD